MEISWSQGSCIVVIKMCYRITYAVSAFLKHIYRSLILVSTFLYQAAAYYYHGLILDKGSEPSSHISAVCCFLAAEELLLESKKACLSFCLASPVTRLVAFSYFSSYISSLTPSVQNLNNQLFLYVFVFIFARSPPLWGAMKHLHQKIPEVASRKSQMYGYLLEQEK